MKKNVRDFFRKGTIAPIALAISAVIGLMVMVGIVANPLSAIPTVNIRTEPQTGTLVVGELFTVQLIIESSIPVNAFQGDLAFDSSVLTVDRIDYNTSIADLWVVDPWYSNGEGTINFAGGTTQKGGFVGEDTLMTITFRSTATGTGFVGITNARILKHDGLGTDAVVQKSIDAIFTIENSEDTTYDVLRTQQLPSTQISIITKKPNTDLNGDGKTNIADLSIFMLHMAQKNLRSDFNQDGKVNLKDLSIIMRDDNL